MASPSLSAPLGESVLWNLSREEWSVPEVSLATALDCASDTPIDVCITLSSLSSCVDSKLHSVLMTRVHHDAPELRAECDARGGEFPCAFTRVSLSGGGIHAFRAARWVLPIRRCVVTVPITWGTERVDFPRGLIFPIALAPFSPPELVLEPNTRVCDSRGFNNLELRFRAHFLKPSFKALHPLTGALFHNAFFTYAVESKTYIIHQRCVFDAESDGALHARLPPCLLWLPPHTDASVTRLTVFVNDPPDALKTALPHARWWAWETAEPNKLHSGHWAWNIPIPHPLLPRALEVARKEGVRFVVGTWDFFTDEDIGRMRTTNTRLANVMREFSRVLVNKNGNSMRDLGGAIDTLEPGDWKHLSLLH